MNEEELLIKTLKNKIEESGFVLINEELNTGDKSTQAYRLMIAHKICFDTRYMQDPTNSFKIFKNPNFELSEDVRRTNESVRRINKWFIASIIFSIVAAVFAGIGLSLQYRSICIQFQQLQQSQKPTQLELDSSVKSFLSYPKDTILIRQVK